MNAADARKLIGKRVEWQVVTDPNRLYGAKNRSGVVQDVRGKNVLINDNWLWLPDLKGLKLVATEP